MLDFCKESSIYEKPEHIKLPTAGGPPVQLIADPSEGFVCTASIDCSYAVKDLETMQRHGREKHSTTQLMDIQYLQCQVQHIFMGVGNSYFATGQNVMPGARPDVKAIIQATYLPTLDVALVIPANTERERTPLMPADESHPETGSGRNQEKHTEEECGGILTCLASTIRDHMARASTILDGHRRISAIGYCHREGSIFGSFVRVDIRCHREVLQSSEGVCA
jgi:hypothetical protein